MNTTMSLIQEKIGHLLPNNQVLNFHDGMPVLPDWLVGNLRLMMGAGDLNHDGIPNVAKFNTYDVFLCQPWDWNGSLLENVTHLLTTRKVLCFLDINNPNQVAAFTELFSGRFAFIDGHGGHCPHFVMSDVQKLLQNGGKATNIYEYSESCLQYSDLQCFLEKGYIPNCTTHNILTGRLYNVPAGTDVDTQLREKISQLLRTVTQIQFSDDTLAELSSLPTRSLQNILRILMFDNQMPVNLKGAYVQLQKDWQDDAYQTFVVTKEAPDFKTDRISAFIMAAGIDHAAVIRANLIIDAINADVRNGDPFLSKAKYRTFCKHVDTKMILA
jgi:hypothetical protein